MYIAAEKEPSPGVTVASSPYLWPWNQQLDPGRSALVVLSAPGAPLSQDLKQEVQTFSEEFIRWNGLVVPVQTADPAGRLPAREHEQVEVRSRPSVHPIKAAGLDGFFGSSLDQTLRRYGRGQLLLAGTWLETSVHSTMRSANDRGYECLVLTDLAPALHQELAAGAVSSIEMSGGIFGAVSTAQKYRTAVLQKELKKSPR